MDGGKYKSHPVCVLIEQAGRCRAGLFLLGVFQMGYVVSSEKTFVEYASNWVPN